jgi:hypothetical protein
MIQPNELRIGNYVRDNLGGILRIKGIKDESVLFHIKPIPITEDILLKCGFERDIDIVYRYYLTYDYSILLAYDIDDNRIRLGDSWDFGNIIFIHELQNLYFALTKTELTITL